MIFRWISRVFKKEHDLFARYERSHPHFLVFIAIDAAISVALVVGGFALVSSLASNTHSSIPMGVAAVSEGDLVSHARADNTDVFWLGPVRGAKYTLNDQVLRIVDIFYWPGESGNRIAKQFLYEVKTYESQDVWGAHTHPILAIANTTTIAINRNISIKINKSSMKGVIATFADKPEIVAIAYPKPQTLKNMIKDVESLKLVR